MGYFGLPALLFSFLQLKCYLIVLHPQTSVLMGETIDFLEQIVNRYMVDLSKLIGDGCKFVHFCVEVS
jgi:hypothetical protein